MNSSALATHHLGRRQADRFLSAASPYVLDSHGHPVSSPQKRPPLGQVTASITSTFLTDLGRRVEKYVGVYAPGVISNATRKKMSRNGTVNLALRMIQAPVLKRTKDLAPECKGSREIAAFAGDWWQEHGLELVRDMMQSLIFGHAPFEKIWEHRKTVVNIPAVLDPTDRRKEIEPASTLTLPDAWLYRKIKPVDPNTVRYLFADEPPYKEVFAGYRQGEVDVLIADRKAFVMTHDKLFNNPYGSAHVDYGYENWYYGSFGRLYSARYYERQGSPTTKGWAPTGADPIQEMVGEGGQSTSTGSQNNLGVMRLQLENMRSSGVAVFPSDLVDEKGNRLWDAEYMESAERGNQWIAYLDHLKLALFLDLCTPGVFRGKNTGTYAETDALQNVYLWLTNYVLYEVIIHVNKYVWPDMVQLTFGADAPLPRLPLVEIPPNNLTALTEVLKSAAVLEAAMWTSAGKPVDPLNSLSYRLGIPDALRQLGLTPRSDDEVQTALVKTVANNGD